VVFRRFRPWRRNLRFLLAKKTGSDWPPFRQMPENMAVLQFGADRREKAIGGVRRRHSRFDGAGAGA